MQLLTININKLKKFDYGVTILFLGEEFYFDGRIQRNFLINGETWRNVGAESLEEAIHHVKKTYNDVKKIEKQIILNGNFKSKS